MDGCHFGIWAYRPHPEDPSVGEVAEAGVGPVLGLFGDGEVGDEGADGLETVELFGGAHNELSSAGFGAIGAYDEIEFLNLGTFGVSIFEVGDDSIWCLSETLNGGLEVEGDVGGFVGGFVEDFGQIAPHEFEGTGGTNATDLEKAM